MAERSRLLSSGPTRMVSLRQVPELAEASSKRRPCEYPERRPLSNVTSNVLNTANARADHMTGSRSCELDVPCSGATASSMRVELARQQSLQSLHTSKSTDSMGGDGVDTGADSLSSRDQSHVVRRMCAADMAKGHPTFALAKLDKTTAELDESRKENKALKRKCKYLEQQVERLQQELSQKHTALEIRKINNNVRLSTQGTIALGIRKAISLTSSVGFPLAALVDCSRLTVVRAEVAVWSSLVGRSRVFHSLTYELLSRISKLKGSHARTTSCSENHQHSALQSAHRSSGTNQSCSDDVHLAIVPVTVDDAARFANKIAAASCLSETETIRQDFGLQIQEIQMALGKPYVLGATEFCGDATNSSIWQNSKLCGLLVTSLILHSPKSLELETTYRKAFAWLRTLSHGCPGHVQVLIASAYDIRHTHHVHMRDIIPGFVRVSA